MSEQLCMCVPRKPVGFERSDRAIRTIEGIGPAGHMDDENTSDDHTSSRWTTCSDIFALPSRV